ncbi:tripartite tricarboxylate transporter substrate-binding protein [Xylophilus sp. GW821-FHT01B05]
MSQFSYAAQRAAAGLLPRRAMLRGAAALSLAAMGAAARAGDYPSRPLMLLIGYAPGGAGDIMTRRLAQKMSENMGQPVIVENRVGAGGVVATTLAAKAKPDGYTLLLTGNGPAISSILFKNAPYNLRRDFLHVSSIASFDPVFIVDGQSRFNSIADLLAYAQTHPGQLSIGTASIGTTQQLAAEMFRSLSGIDAVIVPYKSNGDILAALRARDVQVAVDILPPLVAQITAKSVKALAVTSSKRFPGLPEVPTLAESGLPGFEASSWGGISVPAHTPAAIVERLAREIQLAVASPEFRVPLQNMGFVAQACSPTEMTARTNRDIAKWTAVIEKAGIQQQ